MTFALRAGALTGLGMLAVSACGGSGSDAGTDATSEPEVFWNSATVYFLLTDRFANGDPTNDFALGRAHDGAMLRSFEGGDLAGVLQKLREGYFDSLGVDVLWMTPFQEQILGDVDEGFGKNYGYHGYWIRDWTAVDAVWGTEADLRAVVDEAHHRGIRVLMDAILNHTGPVTPLDPQWPEDWVRTGPRCTYRDYVTTVECTLVDNLPDVLTASDVPVALPPHLVEKWEREGRLDREVAELDAFFERTGYPRAPRYYIIKWLTDWVREYGFDGYRMDTAKHIQEQASAELREEADHALAQWREANPERLVGDLPFYMMGEVYNYQVSDGRDFDFGDRTVDFFDYGYDGLINFGFRWQAREQPINDVYQQYSGALNGGELSGEAILNYISSHDDGSPLDPAREDPLGAGTRLLLAPGGAQIYYGDELARPLSIGGAEGDANLRSLMNWNDIEPGGPAVAILDHWRRLGRFRAAHPAVGAGVHRQLQEEPYIFSRTLETEEISDRVLVAVGMPAGAATIPVFGTFADGAVIVDAYSGETGTVSSGRLSLGNQFGLVLLSQR